LLERKSPFWDIYGIIRRPERILQRDKERLNQFKPSLVLLQRESIQGGDPNFRLSNTPLLKEIREKYKPYKRIENGRVDLLKRND
jgi:hypothetical protein